MESESYDDSAPKSFLSLSLNFVYSTFLQGVPKIYFQVDILHCSFYYTITMI